MFVATNTVLELELQYNTLLAIVASKHILNVYKKSNTHSGTVSICSLIAFSTALSGLRLRSISEHKIYQQLYILNTFTHERYIQIHITVQWQHFISIMKSYYTCTCIIMRGHSQSQGSAKGLHFSAFYFILVSWSLFLSCTQY